MLRRALFMIVVSLVVMRLTAYAQDTPPPAGVDTGKKIGTIVKTAIDTALPGVTTGISTIADLIWKNKSSNNEKIKKPELDEAVKKTRTELITAAQKQIQPVGQVADELALLGKFLTPSVEANVNIIRMQTRLSSSASPVPDNVWKDQKEDWAVAKGNLAAMGSISNDELKKVRDLWLRNMLSKIRDLSK